MLSDLRQHPRTILFDTSGRFAATFPEDHYIRRLLAGFDFLEARQLENYLGSRLLRPRLRVVVAAPYDRDNAFEATCRLVTGAKELTFGVDEAGDLPADEQFKRVIRWRGDRVRLYATAQRPVNLHNDLRSAGSDWCVFQMVNDNDLDVLRACSLPVDDAGVQTLPPRAFLYWRNDGHWHIDKSDV